MRRTLEKMTMSDDFLNHEILDRASLILDMVDRHLLGHPSINEKGEELAQKAHDALYALYQYYGDIEFQTDDLESTGKLLNNADDAIGFLRSDDE